jgi:hypothetical protein
VGVIRYPYRSGEFVAAYFTEQDLRERAGGLTASAARESLRRSAKSAAGTFDVFLSHSVRDAVVILGLRNLLTEQGLRVYVDWIDDPELDRSEVSAATAARLRERMQQSRTLIYATSRASRKSSWMPWELGYFDGTKDSSRVSILPIEDHSGVAFDGQEYLGLYKVIEKVNVDGMLQPYAVRPSRRQAESLRSFANSQGLYVGLVSS